MAAPKTEAKTEEKKPKAGPDFTLKAITVIGEGVTLEQVAPPEPMRTRSVAHSELKANLLKLQETPNTPFEVAHYAARPGSDENPSGAKKIVNQLLLPPGEKGKINPPAIGDDNGWYDIEWRSADYDGSDRKGSVVIAMYVVEAT